MIRILLPTRNQLLVYIILKSGNCTRFYYSDEKQEADLWLLNSCTVKNPAEDFFRNEVTTAKKEGKYLVLAGCVPQGAPKAGYIKV